MRFVWTIALVGSLCATLPAPILERGGPAPDVRHFSEDQLNQQMGAAKPIGEVGQVELNTQQSNNPRNPMSDGSGALRSVENSLGTKYNEPGALITANRDLASIESYRWWKTPLYALVVCGFSVLAIGCFRWYLDKKINQLSETKSNLKRPN